MPKSKSSQKSPEKKSTKVEKKVAKPEEGLEKIIEIDTEEKDADLELIPGEVEDGDPEDDELGLDEEEVDPFKDKWEE